MNDKIIVIEKCYDCPYLTKYNRNYECKFNVGLVVKPVFKYGGKPRENYNYVH